MDLCSLYLLTELRDTTAFGPLIGSMYVFVHSLVLDLLHNTCADHVTHRLNKFQTLLQNVHSGLDLRTIRETQTCFVELAGHVPVHNVPRHAKDTYNLREFAEVPSS